MKYILKIQLLPFDSIDFNEVIKEFQRNIIKAALDANNGNKSHAAKKLKIDRTTLLSKMKYLGMR